jgi:hypothetical protein
MNTKQQHHPQNKFHRRRLSTFPLYLFYSFFTKKIKIKITTTKPDQLVFFLPTKSTTILTYKTQNHKRPPNLTTATHGVDRDHHPHDKISTAATKPPPPRRNHHPCNETTTPLMKSTPP